jgi:hypothetical protein
VGPKPWISLSALRHALSSAARLTRHRQTVVVPLLEPAHTRHALDLACRLASDHGAHVLLVAPLFVDWELPLDAHFSAEEAALRVELAREVALAERYGVSARARIVRARRGELGRGLAKAAAEERAAVVVVGARVDSRHGFPQPFSRDVWSVLDDAPCPVMIVTGPPLKQAQAA